MGPTLNSYTFADCSAICNQIKIIFMIMIFFTCVIVLIKWVCCKRKSDKKIEIDNDHVMCCKGQSIRKVDAVKVLCVDKDADYQRCFKKIMKGELNYQIIWVNGNSEEIAKGKYMLLFNVKSRLPEDAESALKYLGLEVNGKDLVKNILFVAMHPSKKQGDVNKRMGSLDHPLHSFQTINMYYSGKYVSDANASDEIKEKIFKFLSS